MTLNKESTKKPELLAPAGGMTQLVAAVENGADAVYLGGNFLNARNKADNFSDKELAEAVRYAHCKNTKVYLAMNTLVKDEELQEALNYGAFAYELGVDALIIQDMGLACLLRERLPDFPLHLSTQGTVYNKGGVDFARKMGFSRVVTARELTIDEVREVCADSPCDIEVFVHGALCICYSGQCQLSRVIGGRSANRGVCAQPCRLPYTDEDGRNEAYYMSPKDLCLLEELPKLIDAGVASLKIEGRMKSAEYVAVVTGIYRKYIDLYMSGAPYAVDEADMADLIQIYSRGGFTKGFFNGHPLMEDFMSGDLPKHQGKYIGKVVDVPKARDLIDVKLDSPLNMGDGVEIRAEELTGNVITYIKPVGNGVLRIGDIRGRVKSGDEVYKTGDALLNERARNSFQNKDGRFTNVRMEFSASVEEGMKLTVREGDLSVTCQSKKGVEKARKKVVTENIVKEQLSKTGGTAFKVEDINAELAENINISLSNINKIRRKAIEMFEEAKTGRREKTVPGIAENPLLSTDSDGHIKDAPQIPWNRYERLENSDGDGMLTLPPVTKGAVDRDIEDRFRRIEAGEKPEQVFNTGGKKEVLLNNPGWIDRFQKAGFTVYGGPGLNIYNGAARDAYEAMGVVPCWGSFELMKNPPLMTMEYNFPLSTFLDRREERYWAGHMGDKTIIEK